MLPSSVEIQYFLEVASTLNISRAAERLGITQPTLSLSVQRLEHTVGTPLLLRSKTGVRLTKAGVRFASQGKNLIEQWERLRAETINEESEVRGRVSVGCHPSVALYSVGGFAPGLMNEYPGLELTFLHDLSRKITERVVSFEIDFGIVVNPVPHPELRLVPLCTDEQQLWRATGHFAKDVLICEPALMQTQALMAKMKKSATSFQYTRVIHSTSLEVVAALTAAGAGVGILPTRVAKREAGDKVKLFSPKGPIFEDKVYLVYRPDAQKNLAAKTVMRAIEASFK